MEPRSYESLLIVVGVVAVLLLIIIQVVHPLVLFPGRGYSIQDYYQVPAKPSVSPPPKLAYKILGLAKALQSGERINISLLRSLLRIYLETNTTPLIIGSEVVFIFYDEMVEELDGKYYPSPTYLYGSWQTSRNGLPEEMISVGEGFWILYKVFPRNALFQYCYEYKGGITNDPYNPLEIIVRNYMGAVVKESLLVMPGHILPSWFYVPGRVQRGTLYYYYLKDDTGRVHRVTLYKPPSNMKPDRIIYFINGDKYLYSVEANRILDYLITMEIIPPAYAVFIHPSTTTLEGNPILMEKFLTSRIIPYIESKLGLENPERIIAGAGTSGAAALITMLKHPYMYKTVILQAPILNYYEENITRLIKQNPTLQGTTIYITLSKYDYKKINNTTITIADKLEALGAKMIIKNIPIGPGTALYRETLGYILTILLVEKP